MDNSLGAPVLRLVTIAGKVGTIGVFICGTAGDIDVEETPTWKLSNRKLRLFTNYN